MRSGTFAAALAVLITGFLPHSVSAQIVVGSPDDPKPPSWGWIECVAFLGDGRRVHSEWIYVEKNSFYDSSTPQEFRQFVRQNYGNTREPSCSHVEIYWTKPKSNETDIYTDWTGGHPTEAPRNRQASTKARPADPPPQTPPDAAEKKIPNWELKYQQELAAYQQRLKEIEQINADREATIAKNEADLVRKKGEAQQALDQHRREREQAEAAQRRYQQELAAHQALVKQMETKEDRDRAVDWKEAVVVCTFDTNNPQTRFGNWRCDGPLQFTYAKLGDTGLTVSPGALTALSEACGSSRESVHDLGMVSGYRVFGCSFGLHPTAKSGFHLDAARKYGLEYVPGRSTYRCPVWKSHCRTT